MNALENLYRKIVKGKNSQKNIIEEITPLEGTNSQEIMQSEDKTITTKEPTPFEKCLAETREKRKEFSAEVEEYSANSSPTKEETAHFLDAAANHGGFIKELKSDVSISEKYRCSFATEMEQRIFDMALEARYVRSSLEDTAEGCEFTHNFIKEELEKGNCCIEEKEKYLHVVEHLLKEGYERVVGGYLKSGKVDRALEFAQKKNISIPEKIVSNIKEYVAKKEKLEEEENVLFNEIDGKYGPLCTDAGFRKVFIPLPM